MILPAECFATGVVMICGLGVMAEFPWLALGIRSTMYMALTCSITFVGLADLLAQLTKLGLQVGDV
jgi:hypothetical protein